MPVAGQPGQHRLRGRGGVPVVHRHPVPASRERPRDRRADTARPAGDENSPNRHYASHSDSSLVTVAQFRAVPVVPAFGALTIRISAAARSLLP